MLSRDNKYMRIRSQMVLARDFSISTIRRMNRLKSKRTFKPSVHHEVCWFQLTLNRMKAKGFKS